MLKALDLVGFKSFADRTRFEFPDGITVVVGPNGSGKSNIVDAIKWVLGAQSAKSLRGADMADVIFKGSAAGGRKPANSAEATLVFDNEKKLLPVDATEVHVTRRVYRSGESEYLINGAPCRLKDVKDLFRGTGVGVDAYSLIEQGKVDRMLQASPKDRRAIFEEAAGISRFKAKKVETERRLARVEQSLLRLGDIVEEVRTRYETLQNQADKARRFREMNQKLSKLRSQLGLHESRLIQKQRTSLLEQSQELSHLCDGLLTQFESARQQKSQVELKLHEIAIEAQSFQNSQQTIRQNIASQEAKQVGLRQRLAELADERQVLQARLRALRQKAVWSIDELSKRRIELDALEREHRDASAELNVFEIELDACLATWRACQQTVESHREEYLQLLHLSGKQSNLIATERQSLAQIGHNLEDRRDRMASFDRQIQEVQGLIESDLLRFQTLREEASEKHSLWQAGQARLQDLRQELLELQEDHVAAQGRVQGLNERLHVLEELELQREGVGRGASHLIQLSQQHANAPWTSVKGLVADLIEIDVHLAPLVDVALGGAAETVVLEDGQIIEMLRNSVLNLEGRVSMIRLDRLPTRRTGEKIQLDGLRGVIGRADRLVRCAEEFQPLVRSLLGTTWLVDSLATALDLSHLRGAGLRFVTAACERIDSDGILTLGALKSALGLVARKSELQATRQEIEHFQEELQHLTHEIEHAQQELATMEARVRFLDDDARSAHQEASALSVQIDNQKSRVEEWDRERKGLMKECEELTLRQKATEDALAIQADESTKLHFEMDRAKKKADEASLRLKELEDQRNHIQQQTTQHRISIAKVEQRLESQRVVLEQSTKDRDERRSAVEDADRQLRGIEERNREIEIQILDATSWLAQLYLDLESTSNELRQLAVRTRDVQLEQQQFQKRFEQLQRQIDKNREKQTVLDKEASLLQESFLLLVQRFLDEYQIDLNSPELIESTPLLEDKNEAESEAARLRQEIAQVGSVNMESLQELDELQARYENLSSHYKDLTEARDHLLKIIAKINQDSRRLFLETLDAIRANFQLLYRKSFGGGHADILLEEGEDILECGVEIVATPPGKTSLSNSLLSGGEKALTAVALIMAIFQFRPSPFCVLDEVDAPFDEANIGRFVTVLREFLDWTKFIVVTHSKKTMTAANTLYGVTMQENGVSTQVSVCFEDVGENGEILPSSDRPNSKAA